MRQTGKCVKCNGTRIGHLPQLPGTTYGKKYNVPWGACLGVSKTHNALGGAQYMHMGQIQAYICTDCGYMELHGVRSDAFTWEQLPGFQWVPPSGA